MFGVRKDVASDWITLHYSDKIKENRKGEKCDTKGKKTETKCVLVGKPERKKSLGKPGRKMRR
jgi:hypothetical protein